MPGSQQIPFRQTLAPLQGIRMTEPAMYDSELVEVLMDWPPNCNGLVDIAMGIGNTQIYPEHGFLALNATTPIFRGNPVPVRRNTQIWVEFQNHDAANPHTPTVAVTLVEKART